MAKSTTENPAEREEKAPEPVRVRKANEENATHVKYVGPAHVREIDAKSWKAVGAEGQEKVVWDRRNPHKNLIALSDLTPEAVEYLKTDSRFQFVKGS